MTVSEWITLGSVITALVSAGLTAYVKSKQSRLEYEVEAAKTATTARIDETKAILEAWKEVSKDKDVRLARLEKELGDERSQHRICMGQASRMEGQLAALLNAQPRQLQSAPPTEMHIDRAVVDTVVAPPPTEEKSE